MSFLKMIRANSIYKVQSIIRAVTVWLAICCPSFALADSFAVVVDTSGSMVDNDRDQMALLSVLMMSDLLVPSEDELIVLPFDGAVRKPADVAKATVLKRSNHPANAVGSAAFVGELYKTLVYKGERTFFAPAIRQALDQLEAMTAKKGNQVIILLTDGKSNRETEELPIFEDEISDRLRKSGIQLWVVGLGSEPAKQANITQFFQSRRLGGYVEARTGKDLLPAFATVLDQTTERELERFSLRAGETQSFTVSPSLYRTDWVVMPHDPGRIALSDAVVADPSLRAWRAGNVDHDVIGEVHATHPPKKAGGSVRKGTPRSYRRIRLQGPSPGLWTLKAGAKLELLALHRNNFAIESATNPAPPPGRTLRAMVGQPVCFEAQVASLPSARVPGPITDPVQLDPLDVLIEVRDNSNASLAVSAPSQLDDDGRAPGDAKPGDGRYGKCWTPTAQDAGKRFLTQMDLIDRRSNHKEARSKLYPIEVVPDMVLDLTPNPLVFNGAAKMATGATSCVVLQTGGRAAFFTENTVSGSWDPQASFQIELGYRDTQGAWLQGPPPNEPVSNVVVTVDGEQASRIASSSKDAFTGWSATWEMGQPEHEVCLTMGRRAKSGRSSTALVLRVVPADATYASFGLEFDVPFDVDTVEPGFWEQYGKILIMLGLLVLAASAVAYALRSPPLPDDICLQIWKDDLDERPTEIQIGHGGQRSFSHESLSLKVVSSRSGKLLISYEGEQVVEVGHMIKHDERTWFRLERVN